MFDESCTHHTTYYHSLSHINQIRKTLKSSGFTVGFGRNVLFILQVLIQKARNINCDVFACFIDSEMVFDKIPRVKLIDILKHLESIVKI